jgi:hypothetical protein
LLSRSNSRAWRCRPDHLASRPSPRSCRLGCLPSLVLDLADDVEVAETDAHGVARGRLVESCLIATSGRGSLCSSLLLVTHRPRGDGEVSGVLVPERLVLGLGKEIEERGDRLVLVLALLLKTQRLAPPMMEFWGAPFRRSSREARDAESTCSSPSCCRIRRWTRRSCRPGRSEERIGFPSRPP